jgi:nucleotide-binding universal stress UspA family protein
MDGYRTLLVPLDGSELAELAIPVATRLALRDGAELHLVRAHVPLMHEATPGGAEWEAWTREEERDYLEAAAARVRQGGVPEVFTAMVESPVAESICAHAARIEADLVIMATHGRTGFSRLWFGSVADAVVRGSSVPVLLARAAEDVERSSRPYRRIVVPLDGSPSAERIIPHAVALAVPDRAQVTFVRVVVPVHVPTPAFAYAEGDPGPDAEATEQVVDAAETQLSDVVRRLSRAHPWLDAEAVVHVHGQPASAILRVASGQRADLIAMATHGRGGSRLLVGSVADKVLRGTTAAMLVCRSPLDADA